MEQKKTKIEFIYWFAFYNLDSPSVRYRAKFPLEFFRDHNCIESYLVIPTYSLSGISLFLKAYFSALFFRKQNSLIVIQRVKSNFIYANLLKLLVKCRRTDTVYDLDDADYLDVDPTTIFYFVKYCRTISAGSMQIGNYLSRFNSQIIHITSPIVDLGIVKSKKNEIFTIGWVGEFGGEHKDSIIKLIFPAIKELSFKLKLVIIGVKSQEDIVFVNTYFNGNDNMEIEIPTGINWKDEWNLQKRIVLFDVGIATLTDSKMQSSKSGIKVKQYMNNGVPVLSTNLPENNSFVLDSKNGFFCNSVNDFKTRLNQFYEMSEEEYLQFSNTARRSICNFDHNKFLEDFEKIKNCA